MQNFVSKNKWVVIIAGIFIQICTGVPSAWGVFQQEVENIYQISQNETSMIFSFTICFFGIGCILGGLAQDYFGAKILGFVGSLFLGGGFVVSSFMPKNNALIMYIAFSLPVGLGCAILYPAVMMCVQKHFMQKRGFATGIIGIAVGLSGAVLTLSAKALIGAVGIRLTFVVLGVAMFLICGGSSAFLIEPKQKSKQKRSNLKDYTPKQVLKTKQFYLLFLIVALGTPAVLLFSPLILQMCQQRGVPQNLAVYSIILGSVASSLGRLSMPWLSDKIGRRYTDMILFIMLAIASFCFIFAQNWLFIAVYCWLTFCYSGEAAILPSAVTDLYGTKHSGINYGIIALGMSVGSVGFPLISNVFSNEMPRHIIAISAAILGFILLIFLKPTQGERL